MREDAAIGLALVLVVSLTLAGCVGDAGRDDLDEAMDECRVDCPPEDLTSEDGRDLRTDLMINDTVPAPEWEVGDLFGQHIFDDPADSAGFHVDSVVVEDTGSGWVVAPDNEELARRHAYWDLPFLGTFEKGNLATSAYGYDWDFFFEFPLEHGKTWQRSVTVPHPTFFWWNTYEVTFETEYAESVDTYEGRFPGFLVSGTTSEGDLLFSYYYVPMIGWYDQFYWYDLETEDPEDWRLHALSMGTGKNWTGTAYVAQVEQRIEIENFFCPFVTEEFCQPSSLHDSFTLSEGTHLFGIVVAAAWGGLSQIVLQPPEGDTRTYDHVNTDPPNPEGEPEDFEAVTSYEWLDEPSIPGEWQFANLGAGASWGAFLYLVETAMQERTLE